MDEPPPDVSDFIFEPLQLPEGSNAYDLIARAALSLPKREKSPAESEILDAMLNGSTWDENLATICRDDLSAAIPLLERIALVPEGQAPWLSRLSDVISEGSPIRRLNELLQIAALSEAREGNPDHALKTACLALTAGNKIQESHGTLIHYLIGMSMKNSSLKTIRRIVIEHSASPAALKETAMAISQSRSSKQSLAQALHSELRLFEDGLKIMRQGGSGTLSGTHEKPLLKFGPRVPFLLKPNKTRRLYIEMMRRSVAAIDLPLMEQRAVVNNDAFVRTIRRSFVTHPENAMGRVYLAIIVPTTSRILTARLYSETQISTVEALLALHLYQRDHAALPPTLDALVPDYLASVPLDYFDGAPIRYSKEMAAIWSVGEKNLLNPTPARADDAREIIILLAPPAP